MYTSVKHDCHIWSRFFIVQTIIQTIYGLVFTILWKKCAFIVDYEIALTLVPGNETSWSSGTGQIDPRNHAVLQHFPTKYRSRIFFRQFVSADIFFVQNSLAANCFFKIPPPPPLKSWMVGTPLSQLIHYIEHHSLLNGNITSCRIRDTRQLLYSCALKTLS